jgi:hypothetical protein
MDQRLQQIIERLLARQTKEMKIRQECMEIDINVEAKALQYQLKEDVIDDMKALLEGLRSCGKRTTACQLSSVGCPNKSKVGPEGTGAAVDIFKRISDKMEATNLEANPEATEAVVELQELRDNLVVGCRRWAYRGPKTVLVPGRSCPPPGNDRYVAPSLQLQGKCSQGTGQEMSTRKPLKGRTYRNKRQRRTGCKNGISVLDLNEQRFQRKKKMSNGLSWEAIRLQIARETDLRSTKRNECKYLLEVSASSEEGKEFISSIRAVEGRAWGHR